MKRKNGLSFRTAINGNQFSLASQFTEFIVRRKMFHTVQLMRKIREHGTCGPAAVRFAIGGLPVGADGTWTGNSTILAAGSTKSHKWSDLDTRPVFRWMVSRICHYHNRLRCFMPSGGCLTVLNPQLEYSRQTQYREGSSPPDGRAFPLE